MPKSKRIKPSQTGTKVSLEEDIEKTKFAQPKNRNKIRLRQDEEEQFVDSNLSKKILSAAREQQRELEGSKDNISRRPVFPRLVGDEGDSDREEEDNLEPDTFYENIEINEEDERALEMFMSRNPLPQRTLADIIMEKITEKQTELQSQFSDSGFSQSGGPDASIVKLYEGVRDVLKMYRSGKLPKAFKMLPRCKDWPILLNITDPPSWSAAAMYQGTRLFVSNLPDHKAQEFLNFVLLPRIRDDLAEYKRLNFHLYQALKRALYKPTAFMKGILLPLLQSGNCTLREAIIIGSVIARNSIRLIDSATTLVKIAEMDYTGANSIFLRILLDKKYALPYTVVDAVVHHFLRFRFDKRELPVLWHQAFLTFVQRYKNSISEDQCTELLEVLKQHSHHSITSEIRRELQNARFRDMTEVQPIMEYD